MTRQEVYTAINTERDYQITHIANVDRPDMIEDLHIGDTIASIEYNLIAARGAWYYGSEPHQAALEYLRKIAGLIVQAGEKYGLPSRNINKQ